MPFWEAYNYSWLLKRQISHRLSIALDNGYVIALEFTIYALVSLFLAYPIAMGNKLDNIDSINTWLVSIVLILFFKYRTLSDTLMKEISKYIGKSAK